MPAPRRTMRLTPETAPVTPDFAAASAPKVIRSDDATAITFWKRLLYAERKAHGKVEQVLTRQITQLEREVSDLRTAVFQNLATQLTKEQ